MKNFTELNYSETIARHMHGCVISNIYPFQVMLMFDVLLLVFICHSWSMACICPRNYSSGALGKGGRMLSTCWCNFCVLEAVRYRAIPMRTASNPKTPAAANSPGLITWQLDLGFAHWHI